MSTTTSKFMIPSRVSAPRGALWAGAFVAGSAEGLGRLAGLSRRLGSALWRGMEAMGQARARRELLALADRRQADDPALARQLREAAGFASHPGQPPAASPAPAPLLEAASEAEAVRELAQSHLKADPGFAADLFAAANRHEWAALARQAT